MEVARDVRHNATFIWVFRVAQVCHFQQLLMKFDQYINRLLTCRGCRRTNRNTEVFLCYLECQTSVPVTVGLYGPFVTNVDRKMCTGASPCPVCRSPRCQADDSGLMHIFTINFSQNRRYTLNFVQCQSILPTRGEILYIHFGIWLCFTLTPKQESLFSRESFFTFILSITCRLMLQQTRT